MATASLIRRVILVLERTLSVFAGGNAIIISTPKLFFDDSEIISETYFSIPGFIIYFSGICLFIGGVFIFIKETSTIASFILLVPSVLCILSGTIFDESIKMWLVPPIHFVGILVAILGLKYSYFYISKFVEHNKLA